MCWFTCKCNASTVKSVTLNVNVKGLNVATNGQSYPRLYLYILKKMVLDLVLKRVDTICRF